MMVRSAENEVSKTRSNPRRRSAAVSAPSTSAPGFAPNSSASVTDTDGACWTTTNFSGSARAARTSSSALCSASAPVGQTATHWPQLTQLLTLSPSSNAGPDVRAAAAADEVDRADRLDLLADPHALAAEDALGRVADDRRAGDVELAPRRSPAEVAPPPHAQLLRQRLQLAVARCASSRGSRRDGWPAAARPASCARPPRAASASAPSSPPPPGRRSSAPGRAAPRPRPRTCGRRRSAAARRSGRASGRRSRPAAPRRAASRRPARPPPGR